MFDAKLTQTISLCAFQALPERGAKGFDPYGEGHNTLFVIRQGENVYAYWDLCPHYGDTALPWRKDEYLDKAGQAIVCAAHGARFDIQTGQCTQGPCLGDYLTAVPLRVDDDGQVLADIKMTKND